MKALVTGAYGFVGRFLIAELTAASWEVVTVSGSDTAERVINLTASLKNDRPDVVFNMAGVTRADNFADFYLGNTVFVSQLLDAVSRLPEPPLVILAGSAAEYGALPAGSGPVSEDTPCHPMTHYGISKYAQTLMGLKQAAAGFPVIVARIWNPVGPGMPRHLALSNFASQIAAMPPEGGELRVGNLDVERDFVDVREVARLIVALANCRAALGTVVNVCSGRAWSLRSLVNSMIRIADRRINLVLDMSRVRQQETPLLCGDAGRMITFGLKPSAPDFDHVLLEIMASARN